jgi:DNA replication protein DnaC
MEHISTELFRKPREVTFTCQECGQTKTALYRGRGIPIKCLECEEAAEERVKRKEEVRKQERLLFLSHLPPVTRQSCTFDKFEVRSPSCAVALRTARSFVAGKRRHHFLTFGGDKGRGKTHLALAVGWEWFDKVGMVCYYHTVEMLDYLRAGYHIQEREELYNFDQRMVFFKTVPLLILDDLGTQKSTEWARERLDSIVDARWLNAKPTVFTTNLKPEEMEEREEGRLGSRIHEGVVVVIETDEDYRVARAKSRRGIK